MPDCYPELTETQRLIRDTARKVVERELKPHVTAMEHGDVLPYPHIRDEVRPRVSCRARDAADAR